MHPTPDIGELSGAVLALWYDRGAFHRGTTYAAQRRVRVLGHRPGSITGVVRGSARNPYVVEVVWAQGDHGLALSDRCSCPLGGSCKHCVALVLTVRADAARDPAAREGSAWRGALSGLLVEAARAATAEVPLALEVAVQRPKASR
jgi:uncharacterized Zn finger protein